jgi:U4/U6.U5 tri-snRNP component SNU23
VSVTWTTLTVEHVSCPPPPTPSFTPLFPLLPSLSQLLIDLRAIGQTTRVERSTVEQVRAKIASLRAQTKEASQAKAYDFDKRLAEIRDNELAARAEKKATKKAEREKARLELAQDAAAMQVDGDGDAMMNMMGFSGFGTTKK